MKVFVFTSLLCFFINPVWAACDESECSTSMMKRECGVTGNGVGCTYEDGPGCDSSAFCYCKKSNLEFVDGIGCACPDGQYGALGNGTCYPCPGGWTSDVGYNLTITSCYIPFDTPLLDGAGHFTYTTECYYSE